MEKANDGQGNLDREYRPKDYSASQNLIMSIKVLVGAALIGGILWAINAGLA
jgi:hypothetical protein